MITNMLCRCLQRCRFSQIRYYAINTQHAEQLLKNKRFDQVLQVCDKELQTTPNDAQALVFKSQALIATGNLDDAIPLCEQALDTSPDNVRALLTLATIYDRDPKAIPYLDRILALHPNQMEALRRRALQEMDQHEGRLTNTARAMLERVITTTSSDEDEIYDYYNKGLASDLLDKDNDAIGWMDRILKVDPNHAQALFHKGQLLLRGDAQSALKAAQCFQQLTKLLPSQPTFWYNLFAAWRKVGRVGDARKALQKAIDLDPEDDHLQLLMDKLNAGRQEYLSSSDSSKHKINK
jgi:tetratricopeptide (TPR) repeat protein